MKIFRHIYTKALMETMLNLNKMLTAFKYFRSVHEEISFAVVSSANLVNETVCKIIYNSRDKFSEHKRFGVGRHICYFIKV